MSDVLTKEEREFYDDTLAGVALTGLTIRGTVYALGLIDRLASEVERLRARTERLEAVAERLEHLRCASHEVAAEFSGTQSSGKRAGMIEDLKRQVVLAVAALSALKEEGK